MIGYEIEAKNDTLYILLDKTSDPDKEMPHLRSWKLVQGDASEIESFAFQMNVNHVGFNEIGLKNTYISVKNLATKKEEFYGRVIQVTSRMDSDGTIYKEITCAGAKDFLKDSVQFYRKPKEYALSAWITELLDRHNSMMDSYRKIYPGTISVSGFTGTEEMYTSCETTWEVLQDLVEEYGGEINIRSSGGTHYLDYVDKFGNAQGPEIKLADNIVDIEFKQDRGGIITRLYPIGAIIKKETEKTDSEEPKDDESEEETEKTPSAKATDTTEENEEKKEPEERRYGIADANGGVNYIEDAAGIAAYGRFAGVQIWDDVTDPEKLLQKGRAWLNRQKIFESITANVLDLSVIDSAYQPLERFNTYVVSHSLLGIRQNMRIVKKTITSDAPHKPQITFGDKGRTLADAVKQNSKNTRRLAKRIDKAISEV